MQDATFSTSFASVLNVISDRNLCHTDMWFHSSTLIRHSYFVIGLAEHARPLGTALNPLTTR